MHRKLRNDDQDSVWSEDLTAPISNTTDGSADDISSYCGSQLGGSLATDFAQVVEDNDCTSISFPKTVSEPLFEDDNDESPLRESMSKEITIDEYKTILEHEIPETDENKDTYQNKDVDRTEGMNELHKRLENLVIEDMFLEELLKRSDAKASEQDLENIKHSVAPTKKKKSRSCCTSPRARKIPASPRAPPADSPRAMQVASPRSQKALSPRSLKPPSPRVAHAPSPRAGRPPYPKAVQVPSPRSQPAPFSSSPRHTLSATQN